MSIRNFCWPAVALVSTVVGLCAQSLGADAVSWRSNLDAAKIEATQSGKLVLLHFYTSTCGPCKMLDQNVFSQPQIGDEIERNYVPVKINAEENPAIAAAYRVERVPSEIVLNNQGNVVASLSCPQSPSEYTSQLSNLADHHRQRTSPATGANQAPVQAAYAGLQVGQYANQAAPQQQAGSQTPAVPTSTNNPYTTQSPAISPVASNAYGNPSIALAGTQQVQASMPANAMPNSYRQQAGELQQPVQQGFAANAPAVQQQVVTNPKVAPAQINNPAAQVSPASHMSVARQLPAGTPPLAFDGYCPVALRSNRKWVAGNAQFGAIHRGRTFLFMGEEQRQQFLANPDAYCPVFSGIDPVLLLDNDQVVEGSRRFGFDYRGAFYLFSSQDSMNRFKSQPDLYAAGVRQAMSRMETSAGGQTVLK
jgi:YHS domain-containing protein/thioredoxin-like negative regulator of GroEL